MAWLTIGKRVASPYRVISPPRGTLANAHLSPAAKAMADMLAPRCILGNRLHGVSFEKADIRK